MIPDGELVTVPVPVPDFVTVNPNVGAGENVAVTFTAAVPTVNEHVPVPEQAPVQPAKIEVGDTGVAVSVTAVPEFSVALQVPEAVPDVLVQLIPPTLPATEPDPVPAVASVTANDAGMKFALTDCAALMVTTHVPVPEQPAPLHPANTDAPEDGVAVRVTTVF